MIEAVIRQIGINFCDKGVAATTAQQGLKKE